MIRAGYGYDLSALLDDDEERRRAEEAAAGVAPPDPPAPEPPPVEAPPEPAPAAAQPSAPEPNADDSEDPFAGLADLGAQNPVADLPPPPERQKPDEGPAALGLALDVLLNKGRHVPQMIAQFGQPEDTDYENWKRKLEWAKARAGRSGAASPYTLAIRAAELKARQKALGLQAQGVGIRQRGQKVREDESARKLNNADPRTRATQDWVIAHSGYAPDSPDAERIRQMDDQALGRVMTGMMKDAETRSGSPLAAQDVTHAAEKAGATSHATVGDRIAVAEAAARIAAGKNKQENEDLSQITGWHRRANAPELKPAESEALRKTDAAAEQYRQALIRLRDAVRATGADDYLLAKGGKITDAMAAAKAAHTDVLTKQRVLENLGTPQAAELKMVNAQVPAPDSLGGQVNGEAQYGALLSEYDQNHTSLMNKMGYERDELPSATTAPAAAAPSSPRKHGQSRKYTRHDLGGL